MCITVSRRGTCQSAMAAKCEKDGKVYVERVPGSERGFEHLTEHEDIVVSRDDHSLLRQLLLVSYSLILPQTSQSSLLPGYLYMKKSVCHKVTFITFSTKKLLDFYNNQSLKKALLHHNTNFATVHSRVTVGGAWRSTNFVYELLVILMTAGLRELRNSFIEWASVQSNRITASPVLSCKNSIYHPIKLHSRPHSCR